MKNMFYNRLNFLYNRSDGKNITDHSTFSCRRGSMAEHKLPKLGTRVRFPSLALSLKPGRISYCRVFIFRRPYGASEI